MERGVDRWSDWLGVGGGRSPEIGPGMKEPSPLGSKASKEKVCGSTGGRSAGQNRGETGRGGGETGREGGGLACMCSLGDAWFVSCWESNPGP